jgi:DNA-binding transcriptional MerR regulator
MNDNLKSNDAYKTIGEITKELGLVNKKTGHLQTHTLRYWETQFKQIKPLIRAGKRRYYSKKNFEIIKMIMFYLKEKGLTINGVKKILDSKKNTTLDDNDNSSLYRQNLKVSKLIKNKVKKISKIVSELKYLK